MVQDLMIDDGDFYSERCADWLALTKKEGTVVGRVPPVSLLRYPPLLYSSLE
jgi:hypothetical protein